MRYTFEKDFYEEGDKKLSLVESYKWNKMVLKIHSKNHICRFINTIKSLRFRFELFFYHFYKTAKLLLTTKFVVLKLIIKGKKALKIDYSPYSESRYISYLYLDYCVKIRISQHQKSNNDNSHIYIYI